MEATSEISVVDLVKSYKGRRVVDGVSLSIKQGEIVGLLGPNGAGKTTTFYMIVGLVRPNSGRVYLDGRDITDMPMYQRARLGIGYLAQEPSVFRKLTVAENIILVLEAKGVDYHNRIERTNELLHALNLETVRNHKGYMLSGGERRRTEIARALAVSPRFMLLDEPFTGVDPIAIGELKRIVADLQNMGIGVIITDHNVAVTLAITHRAYIISEGRIATAGLSKDLPDDPIAKEHYLGDTFD